MTTMRQALELSNTALRVFIARMILQADEEPVTIEAIMRITGLGKSTVYRGRSELIARFPELTGPPEPGDKSVGNVDNFSGDEQGADLQNDIDETPDIHNPQALLLLQGQDHVSHYVRDAPAVSNERLPIPLWRQAVVAKMTELTATGRVQSYNLAADVYLPAYSELSDVRECIALAVDYVETLDDAELNPTDRALVAKLIRKFGKIGLYGLDVALGVTDEDTGRDRFRYARQVAARKLEELRAGRAARESADSSETAK